MHIFRVSEPWLNKWLISNYGGLKPLLEKLLNFHPFQTVELRYEANAVFNLSDRSFYVVSPDSYHVTLNVEYTPVREIKTIYLLFRSKYQLTLSDSTPVGYNVSFFVKWNERGIGFGWSTPQLLLVLKVVEWYIHGLADKIPCLNYSEVREFAEKLIVDYLAMLEGR